MKWRYLAAAILAIVLFSGGSQTASAQTSPAQVESAVVPATSANLKDMVSPPLGASYRYLFIYICDSAAPSCAEDVQMLALT